MIQTYNYKEDNLGLQLVNEKNAESLLHLIDDIKNDSFMQGYNYAVETIQNTVKKDIKKHSSHKETALFIDIDNTVKEFLEKIFATVHLTCLPYSLLAVLYKNWIKDKDVTFEGRNKFIFCVDKIVSSNDYGWQRYHGRIINRMDGNEPFLEKYGYSSWKATHHSQYAKGLFKLN